MKRATIPRAVASGLACLTLVGLTLMSFRVAGHHGSSVSLAILALLKVSLIGAVFLELDRSRPAWALAFVAYFAAFLSVAAWLIAG